MIGVHETIDDVVTQSYRLRRRLGNIIMNPMTLVRIETRGTDSTSMEFSERNFGSANCKGDTMSAIITLVPTRGGTNFSFDGAKANIALARAYATINSTPIMSGEILSDYGKTISMLRHPFRDATSLLKQITSMRTRLMKRSTYNVTRASASAWLEYRYGWRPIISDSIEIMRQAEKIRSGKSVGGLRVARASESSSFSRDESYDVSLLGAYRCVGTKRASAKQKVSAGVLYRAHDSDRSEQVLQALGLRSRDIPATIWEIVPFSFVADWFTNAGQWIDAVTPNPGVSILGSWITTVTESEADFPPAQMSRVVNGQTFYGSSSSQSTKWTTVTRRINPALASTPNLTFKPLSNSQTADALALTIGKISQSLKGLRH